MQNKISIRHKSINLFFFFPRLVAYKKQAYRYNTRSDIKSETVGRYDVRYRASTNLSKNRLCKGCIKNIEIHQSRAERALTL